MSKNYYNILGVSESATAKEIKKAYKRLAMKHHPDRNVDNKKASEEKFKTIQKAYAILSDEHKRQMYDQYGEEGLNGQTGFNGGNPFGSSGFGGFEDLFGQFFSGHGSSRQASDYQYELDLAFDDAITGSTVKIRIPSTSECTTCVGSGAKPGTSSTTCGTCKGSGDIQTQQGFFSVSRVCHSCQGSGRIIKQKCNKCDGNGSVQEDKSISVKIPAGIDTGNRIRVTGEGEYIGSEYPKGDLYIVVNVLPHAIMKRDGINLSCQVPIGIDTAILGGQIDVPVLKGLKSLKIPEGIQTNTVLRVKNQGVPRINSPEKGDLFCEIIVETPINLSGAQKELVRKFSGTLDSTHHPESKSFIDKIKSFF